MWKTGPCPSWYTPWKKRLFVLKGNFLYYFDAANSYDDPPVLGAIFIKNAIIEKDSMPFASHVLTVSPIVKRRINWEGDDESSIFYLKFKTEEDRLEVSKTFILHYHATQNSVRMLFLNILSSFSPVV